MSPSCPLSGLLLVVVVLCTWCRGSPEGGGPRERRLCSGLSAEPRLVPPPSSIITNWHIKAAGAVFTTGVLCLMSWQRSEAPQNPISAFLNLLIKKLKLLSGLDVISSDANTVLQSCPLSYPHIREQFLFLSIKSNL